MEQVCAIASLHSRIRRSLLGQPRENQLSVARWLKLLDQQYRPAMELLVEIDSGRIAFNEAMEVLNSHSGQHHHHC
jgi:tRNA(Arg) A34 adenosine deaminase TadA